MTTGLEIGNLFVVVAVEAFGVNVDVDDVDSVVDIVDVSLVEDIVDVTSVEYRAEEILRVVDSVVVCVVEVVVAGEDDVVEGTK